MFRMQKIQHCRCLYVRFTILIIFLLNLIACSNIPVQQQKQASNILTYYKAHSYLEKKLAPIVQQHRNQTGFFLVANGVDAFAVRSALIQKSTHKIDIQYYFIQEDQSGKKFFNLLKQAANRGVKIRLLIDDIALDADSPSLKDAAAHPNIEVRVFNPFNRRFSRYPQYIFQLGKITRRMHNKSITVDNQISIIGGRNIADEYFQQKKSVNFGDMDVVFIGSLIPKVGQKFDQFWNSAQVELLENLEALPQQSQPLSVLEYASILDKNYYSNLLTRDHLPFSWGKATLIADSPDKILKKRQSQKFIKQTQLRPYLDAVQEEILIFTPYLVPTQTGIQHLKELKDRGVRIILFTNSLATTDVPLVHSGYIKYRKKLLKLGVELYELKYAPYLRSLFKQRSMGKKIMNIQKESLHAKIMVFDRKAFYVGSMNIDPRSVYENTELGVVIESKKVAQGIYAWFNKNIQELAYKVELKQLGRWNNQVVWLQGQQDYLLDEPNTSFFGRVWMDFLSGLPLAEEQL